LILDNYATHNHADVKKWLAKNRRFVTHFTPTNESWLNMVERLFRYITDKRIRRDNFTSVADLEWQSSSTSTNTISTPSPSSGPQAHQTSCRRSRERKHALHAVGA
jgi:transposase